MTNSKMMDVYTIIERQNTDHNNRNFWMKLGVCFTNRDGSYNVYLDALPTNGKLQIRPREETNANAVQTLGEKT